MSDCVIPNQEEEGQSLLDDQRDIGCVIERLLCLMALMAVAAMAAAGFAGGGGCFLFALLQCESHIN